MLMDYVGMQKRRGQVRVNLGDKLTDEFDAECTRTREKPGALASAVLSWYLVQPEFMKAVVRRGLAAVPPEAREQAAKSIAAYLLSLPTENPAAASGSQKPRKAG